MPRQPRERPPPQPSPAHRGRVGGHARESPAKSISRADESRDRSRCRGQSMVEGRDSTPGKEGVAVGHQPGIAGTSNSMVWDVVRAVPGYPPPGHPHGRGGGVPAGMRGGQREQVVLVRDPRRGVLPLAGTRTGFGSTGLPSTVTDTSSAAGAFGSPCGVFCHRRRTRSATPLAGRPASNASAGVSATSDSVGRAAAGAGRPSSPPPPPRPAAPSITLAGGRVAGRAPTTCCRNGVAPDRQRPGCSALPPASRPRSARCRRGTACGSLQAGRPRTTARPRGCPAGATMRQAVLVVPQVR